MLRSSRRQLSIRDFVLSYGFVIALVLVFIVYAVSTKHFLKLTNLMAILHTCAPTLIFASGLALVLMTGKLDISIGSIIFLATATGGALMTRYNVSPWIAFPVMMLIGAVCGAINGFVVTVLKVNPFITTMGSMFVLRGIALTVTTGVLVGIPDFLTDFGSARIGPVFVDFPIALVFVFLVYLLHTRTKFGRYIMAIGNGEEVARRLGVRVERVVFVAFLLSGLFASMGGILSMAQVGGVSLHMGVGLEFTGIAACVIGGISLFGGEGSFGRYVLGVLTLAVIENGLVHMGASVYAYPFVRGGIIFIAMYADTLKSLVQTKVKQTIEEPEPTGVG
ncbi:MAG: ABC transporter permease [Chloroflexi bacterium]|nr:ABC transporter permease [Chloroflexota bacterium]